MARRRSRRAVQLAAATLVAAFGWACGSSTDNPLLQLLAHAVGFDITDLIRQRLSPGGGLVLGPSSWDTGQAVATSVTTEWRCTDGRGLIEIRPLIAMDDAEPIPLDQYLNGGEGEGWVPIDLLQPLSLHLGHFGASLSGRLYYQARLQDGSTASELEIRQTIAQQPETENFDREPNNTLQQAVELARQPGDTSSGSGGSLAPPFGDSVDYYRVATREAITGVRVQSGQTLLISGLTAEGMVLGEATGTDVEVLPLLGDIPVLGRLFRVQAAESSARSLVYMITPTIIVDD